ncbi:glucuronate isomerase [Pseudovibrio sp. Tun.PSC04-5.I4]|uniref:glucuronate isomerase n=1 Tax=Pseudovibrio sp. Tun.PSC04-5.I4 TaxID=1798213 RepID=UPI0008831A26|nr:glucuronate isomerase [Pseudovibrio sp. Tun.PSC04-5.I4]SDQ15408.1 D-glucuronate isomerase [Pseudovibrio sp. Tun.PSC04-5.I4]
MTKFLTEDFLLHSDVAREFYHDFARDMPIIDYHCHLQPELVATDHQFANLTEIWLKGDHYKWRAMRTNAVEEKYCTGSDVSDREKFQKWAETVPATIGNPLYHWTHLELRRPFGIDDCVLNGDTAEGVWNRTNEMLAAPEFSARSIMEKMNVRMVGTTDDPIDDLAYHKAAAEDASFKIKMNPSWRPDKSFLINAPSYVEYLSKLAEVSGVEISSFEDLCSALSNRLDYFAAHGCTISDHALDTVVYEVATKVELNTALATRLSGKLVGQKEADAIKTAVLIFLGKEYARRGWAMQYHIGAMRNNSSRMFGLLGPDTGFDSINDGLIADPLSKLLNALDEDDALPRTILYCLNPRDNEVISAMCGNFQGGDVVGKIQFGSGWWFNDQKDGMLRQMEQLSQLGLLSRFIGMLTDSRSFLSYTRHEYFRRILCNMIGTWVVEGEAPNDIKLLGQLVQDVSFNNANRYFGFDL